MIDFGPVDALDAEAIGPPGRRVFRLRARVGDQYASLWLEKESVVALGQSFSALLAERSKMRGQPAGSVEDVGNFPQAAQVDIHIARLGLDWDGALEHIIVLADDAEAVESDGTPSFRMAIDRSHALRCIDQFHEVAVGGRPTCALCHEALEFVDQPHFCPGSNGHTVEIPLPPLESD